MTGGDLSDGESKAANHAPKLVAAFAGCGESDVDEGVALGTALASTGCATSYARSYGL